MRRLLLTPGPLTTTAQTRAAMNKDWGSREEDFLALSDRLRTRLLTLCRGGGSEANHCLIPLQGSGTFAVEAMVQTLIPRDARLLVLANGAYGRRLAEIARRLGRVVLLQDGPEDRPLDPPALDQTLTGDPAITDVALIHMETTSGLLNPLAALAAVAAAHGRRLLIDAIGSLGAIPIPPNLAFTGLAGSANKGLEGVPGLAFVCADHAHLLASAHTATSLSLDLHDQHQGFTRNRQWRFTPPTQIVAALDVALDQLQAEGGITARHARYTANCRALTKGMAALGFTPYLAEADRGPVIVTFRVPAGGWFDFPTFYDALHAQGVVIYPGKLTREPSFRIGCIGDIGPADIQRALALICAFVATHRPAHAPAG